MKHVLFVCIHNAGRSQMAAGFLERLANGTATAESAGTMPAASVNSVVVTAMREKGIDLSANQPKLLTQEMAAGADRVISMGCSVEEACPSLVVPTEDWALEDPTGKPLEEVRLIRDQIEARVRGLLAEWTEA